MKKKIFALSDILFILLAVYIIIYKSWWFMNADGDILWHIKQGEWYIANRTWHLDRELFSFLYDRREWAYLSWLGDVIFALINKYTGFKGLIIFTDLFVVTTIYMIFRYLAKKGVNIFLILLVFYFGIDLISTHWIVRNHIFGHIFIVIWFIVIENFYEGKNRWLIWTLPFLNIIWVNIHGSYLYGMTIPFFFAAGAFYEWIIEKKNERKKDFIILTSLCFALLGSSFINPFGPMFYYDFFIKTSEALKNTVGRIGDFSSPTFQTGEALKINVFFGIIIFTMIFNKSRVKIHYVLIMLYYMNRSIQFTRDLSILGILGLFIIPQILNENLIIEVKKKYFIIIDKIMKSLTQMEISKVKGLVILNYIVVVLLIVLMPITKTVLNESARINRAKFPVDAVNYMKNKNIDGRILNNYVFGGYIIWEYYPKKLTFCDTRGTFFDLNSYNDYGRAISGADDYMEIIKKYKIEYVLLNKKREMSLYYRLKNNKEAEKIYEDSLSGLFKIKVKKMEELNEKKINNNK